MYIHAALEEFQLRVALCPWFMELLSSETEHVGVGAWNELISGELGQALAASLRRDILGFALGASIGVLVRQMTASMQAESSFSVK